MIHQHTYGHCKYGMGQMTEAIFGSYGAWIGPSHSVESIVLIIQDIFGTPPEVCSC